MISFAEKIKSLRKARKLTLVSAASELGIDTGILSKIENGKRKATREQVTRFSQFYQIPEKELLLLWVSDNLAYEIRDEEDPLKILKAAEEKIRYSIAVKNGAPAIIEQIRKVLSSFPQISKAWIYGSFSRGDDNPLSDVDIALQTSEPISYFDLAEIQFRLENEIHRKADVGFIESFKTYILNNIIPDLRLIYER